jgi:hypothetical protein
MPAPLPKRVRAFYDRPGRLRAEDDAWSTEIHPNTVILNNVLLNHVLSLSQD